MDDPEVKGHRINLSRGRIVFLGYDEAFPETCYVGFRSARGEDNKLALSIEALDALVALRTSPPVDEPLVDFPHKMVWQVVTP